jgi:hypothetical protein
MKMCFNEVVSWLTLALGSIVNTTMVTVLLLTGGNNPQVVIPIMLIIGWQYSLLMQIPDALAWRNPEARYPGKLAFILNTTQPLIATGLVGVMLRSCDVSLVRLLPAFAFGAAYAVRTASEAYGMSFDLTPLPECTNLHYPWWNDRTSLLLYFATTLAAVAAIPSVTYMVLSLVLFCVTVLISKQMLAEACNSGSLWCWSVAGSGLVTGCFALRDSAWRS